MSSIDDSTESPKNIPETFEEFFEINKIQDPSNPIYEIQDKAIYWAMHSTYTYNDEETLLMLFILDMNKFNYKIKLSDTISWSNDLIDKIPINASEAFRVYIYYIIHQCYKKFISMVSDNELKKRLSNNLEIIMLLNPEVTYDSALYASKSFIDTLGNKLNSFIDIMIEPLKLDNFTENELINDMLIKKNVFYNNASNVLKSQFNTILPEYIDSNVTTYTAGSINSSRSIKGGMLQTKPIKFTKNYIYKTYGMDSHVNNSKKISLRSFLDINLPIRINIPQKIDDQIFSNVWFTSNEEEARAEDVRAEGFEHIMENTFINMDGEMVPFIKYIISLNSYSRIISEDIYKWAESAMDSIIEMQFKRYPEFIYTGYITINGYYKRFIDRVSKKFLSLRSGKPYSNMSDEDIKKHNRYIALLLTNLQAGHELFIQNYGKHIEQFSTKYAQSLIQKLKFKKSNKLPELQKSDGIASLDTKIIKLFKSKIKVIKKDVGIINKLFKSKDNKIYLDSSTQKDDEEMASRKELVQKIEIDTDHQDDEIYAIPIETINRMTYKPEDPRIQTTMVRKYNAESQMDEDVEKTPEERLRQSQQEWDERFEQAYQDYISRKQESDYFTHIAEPREIFRMRFEANNPRPQ